VGGTLEDRPIYTKTRCFDPFPFPACTDAQQQTIRDLAERLDAHRKRQQQLHPWLTLTDMYNVLDKLRALSANPASTSDSTDPASFVVIPEGNLLSPIPNPQTFTEHDHNIYTAGLIAILRELHDELDRAAFAAYGWPENPTALTTEQILERIVALNAERRAEEASGLIRWLRPEYQTPNAVAVTAALAGFVDEMPVTTRRKQPWPAAIPDQFSAVRDALRAGPLQTPQQIAASFRPASRTRVAEILATLTALGQARESAGRYSL
jgi:hypothetical protein